MKSLSYFLFVIILFPIVSSPSFAGGPLYTLNGKSARYQSNIITYKLDRGAFGIFTSAQARTLANASFKSWEDVTSSNVMFQHTDADTLPVDVNGTNYLQYTTLTDFKYDGMSPIIFDSDGAITNALFGTGASASVIGFAGSGDSNNDGYFDEGESVMNGVFANGGANSFTLEEWKSTFVHEFGHFLGLDHTQINGEYENDAAKTIYIPTMYPFATANDIPLGDLNPDDIAAISALYPETNFAASTGKISGSITRSNASVVRGANVIAISTGADSLMNRISTVSDYFEQNTGNYTITGLAPGSYVVRIEPIDPNFIEGSSVGPYAIDASGLSFVNPVSMEYYNGINESSDPATDNPNEKTPVSVTVNATLANINFVANKVNSGGGSVLLIEDFTGNAGTALTSAGWTISGTSTVNSLSIVQPGLSISGYPSTGNSVSMNTNGQDVYKSFTPVTGGSVYLSFLMKVDSVKTGDYFIALSASSAQTNYFSRLHIKSSGAGFLLGISKLNEVAGGSKYGTSVFNLNTTYLVVVKYEFLTGATTNDQISVFAFASSLPTTEPGTQEISTYTNALADAADFGFVTLRQGSSSSAPYLVIDGIRVGTSWPGTITEMTTVLSLVPSATELMQNYPNPFNPTTSIRFALPSAQNAMVKIFDLLGRKIATIAEGIYSAGIHEVSWNGSTLASGTYFYMLETENHREIKRMVLLK
jgi:hypothetical protein